MEIAVDDYRVLLRSFFEAKRKANPRFSFRQFASLVGFKSPNYLQMILDGRRNLRADTATLMAQRLKLASGERDYFVALVKIAGASSESEKVAAERSRLAALKKIISRDIPVAQREVFTKWYHFLVRELFLIPGAPANPKWIVARLGGCITEQEAAESLELLCKTGFLRSEGDSFKPVDPVLDTNDQQMQAAFMRQFHSQTLRVWAQNLDRLRPPEQELGVLNIPIHSSKIPELRRRIRQFQDEILGFVQDEADADCVIQLGTYLIPFPKIDDP